MILEYTIMYLVSVAIAFTFYKEACDRLDIGLFTEGSSVMWVMIIVPVMQLGLIFSSWEVIYRERK